MASGDNPLPPTSHPGGAQYNTGNMRGDMQHQPNYTPNEHETIVLRECQRESFLFRALPFGLLAGTSTFVLIQRGVLTTKSRLGPFPKVIFAGFLGYMFGKMSYISTCKQKFLKLENSPIAEMLRKGVSPGAIAARTQFGKPMENFGPQDDADDIVYMGGSDNSSKVGDDYSTNLDVDISYSGQDGAESYDQSSLPGPHGEFVEEKRPEMTKTYDQLRKENRATTSKQYREVLPGHFQKKLPQSSDDHQQRPPARRISSAEDEFSLGRSQKMRTNTYGDLLSDE